MISTKTLDKLHARRDANRDIVTALRNTARTQGLLNKRELLALAYRIEKCGQMRNTFIAKDATNFSTGELFDAVGQYWSCGSKLCCFCIARFSRENRKKLRDALAAQKLRKGERYYFATFTIPNIGAPLDVCREIVNEAWSLFRKRLLCVSLIRGGCKSEEFTVTARGFHYHHHHIMLAKYLSFQEVRRTWTECVKKAFETARLEFQVNTSDGLLFVNLKTVTDLDSLVHEVCKYITKSDSWQKMRPSDLADIGLVRRWFRMFELYGSFAPRNTSEAPDEENDAETSRILDTMSLTDGFASPHIETWRDAAIRMDPDDYAGFLDLEIDAAIELRTDLLHHKWQFATLISLAQLTEHDFSDAT